MTNPRDRVGDSNERRALTVAVAGNPNCGKSALFNAFTGIRQKTGNWPGVTVDRKEGRLRLGQQDISVVDLPGIYSLTSTDASESVALKLLLKEDYDLIINVIDGSRMGRSLELTLQLLELGHQRRGDQIAAAGVDKDTTLLFLCRSGARSKAAAIAMTDLGFTRAYNVSEGFEGNLDGNGHRGVAEGWKAAGLPWQQR